MGLHTCRLQAVCILLLVCSACIEKELTEKQPEFDIQLPVQLKDCSPYYEQRAGKLFLIIPDSCFHSMPVQFERDGGHPYSVVIGSNLNIRKSPALDSSVIGQLQKLQKVVVLYKDSQQVSIGGNPGHWALVLYSSDLNNVYATEEPPDVDVVGWVFDYYLAGPKDFQPVERIRPQSLGLDYPPDAGGFISIQADGSFKDCIKSKDAANITYGQIYRIRDVIRAKGESSEGYYYDDSLPGRMGKYDESSPTSHFYLIENGSLSSPRQTKDQGILHSTSDCKPAILM